MVKDYIKDDYLRSNLMRVVDKTYKDYPTVIIIWGPTRSGKSTLAAQCAHFLSLNLKVPYSVDNIYFDSESLFNHAKQGRKRWIYHADEAANDLMGEEWSKKVQKNIIKLLLMGAKFNQIYILCIPEFELLRKAIVRYRHTRFLETTINEDTQERGKWNLYTHETGKYMYNMIKKERFDKIKEINAACWGHFSGKMDFIDIDKYEKKKDQALEQLGEQVDGNKNVWRERLSKLLKYGKDSGLKVVDMAKYSGIYRTQASELIKDAS